MDITTHALTNTTLFSALYLSVLVGSCAHHHEQVKKTEPVQSTEQVEEVEVDSVFKSDWVHCETKACPEDVMAPAFKHLIVGHYDDPNFWYFTHPADEASWHGGTFAGIAMDMVKVNQSTKSIYPNDPPYCVKVKLGRCTRTVKPIDSFLYEWKDSQPIGFTWTEEFKYSDNVVFRRSVHYVFDRTATKAESRLL